ncbi:uncharacterized protein LOC141604819 isoform X3 [Silene latifolia]|uniref:uncharacterized protein LOC141604819 isoform X3 n=1 Tax=Silene latifolia TaxID=37657 RepID=UPI003D7737BA
MKQLMRNNNNNNRDDKDVFEFDEDEFPDGCDHWSKIRAKFSNPNSKNHDVSEPVIQIKEVLTVTLDDNDHYCTDDIPADALDSAHKAGLKESEDLYSMSDRVVKQSSGFIDCNAEQKVSPCCRQIRDSTPLELFPRNGHVCTMIPDSPCCDDPVYFGDSDENDVVQESPSSTPTSELEEDNVAAVGQAQCQSVGGLEMQPPRDIPPAASTTPAPRQQPASTISHHTTAASSSTSSHQAATAEGNQQTDSSQQHQQRNEHVFLRKRMKKRLTTSLDTTPCEEDDVIPSPVIQPKQKRLTNLEKNQICQSMTLNFQGRKLKHGLINQLSTDYGVTRVTISRIWKMVRTQVKGGQVVNLNRKYKGSISRYKGSISKSKQKRLTNLEKNQICQSMTLNFQGGKLKHGLINQLSTDYGVTRVTISRIWKMVRTQVKGGQVVNLNRKYKGSISRYKGSISKYKGKGSISKYKGSISKYKGSISTRVIDSKKGVMETIIVRTDYVTYGDKYFPASLILFSKDSVKIKARTVEEESADSSSDWKIDDILKIETQWSSTTVAKVRILLLANNDVHVEIANGTSGNELVEFLASNWSEHQEQIMSLDVRYNALLSMGINMQNCNGDVVPYEDYEYSSDPYIPNFEEPFEEVVYPKGERDAVSVRKSDVDLLLPDVFINDTIIDFYITYLKNGIPHERRDNFHFFSCFFFRKLADLDKNPSSVFDGKAAFQRVQRWTRKINIFEKDYIFIPVNYNLHWSLIILCHPGEVANFNDENINEALKVPCILHMDSIRGSHAGLKDHFQSYLLEEWKERQKETSEDVYLKFLDLRFLSLELPQQENYSDCGLFLLHYAELFINEAPQNFSPFRINKFDHFLRPNWFIPAEASLKRVYIQRLIHELLKSLSHECASPPKNDFSHSPALPVNKENDDGIEIISEKESLDKSWKGSSLYSQSVQGMDMSVLDMPIYRPSHRVNSSGLGMTELLEQQSQRYDRGASLGQLGFSTSTIREEEGNEHLIHSIMGQTGHQPTDQVGDSHMNCSSRDFDQTISWNSDSSYQVEPEDLSSSSESHSCDDSSDTRILEFANGIQSIDPCSNENTDLSKENMNSPEGFASASSDMMETPAEDSQELAEKYGSHDQDDPSLSNPEHEVEGSQELVSISLSGVDDKLAVEDGKTEDDEVVAAADVDNLVVEDSESEDDEILMGADADNLAVEHSKSEDDEIVTGADRVVEDSPDKPRPAKRLRVSPSPDEEDRV